MGSWSVAGLLSVAGVLHCLGQGVQAFSCNFNSSTCTCNGDCVLNCADNEIYGLAFVVAVCVSLFLGVVLGVVGSVAAYKFMKWMEGKTVTFSPWPKIQSAVGIEDSAMQNPTYELGTNDDTLALKPSAKRYVKNARHQNSNKSHEVYEAIEEPINQAEVLEPTEQFSPLPYAIHDFSEDNISMDTKSGSTTVKGPVVPFKANINRPKKGKGKDSEIRRSMSESGRLETEKCAKPIALKPPIAQKSSVLKKPALKPVPQTHSTAASAAPPQGTYSELDMKTSYATLEPHIGGEDVSVPEPNSKESYCHLNH